MFKPLVTQHVSLYNRIVDEFKSALAEGKLRPGERLPPEREMCLQLGVSRTSLREAMKILAGKGIVSIRHGQGVFVADVNPNQLVEDLARLLLQNQAPIPDLFEIRRLLETAAAGWAAERASPDQLAALTQVVSEARAGSESGNFTPTNYERYDHRFHSLLAEATGNAVLVRVMDNLMDLLRQGRQASLTIEGRPQQSITDHERILESVLKRDAGAAREMMFQHLDGVEASIRQGTVVKKEQGDG